MHGYNSHYSPATGCNIIHLSGTFLLLCAMCCRIALLFVALTATVAAETSCEGTDSVNLLQSPGTTISREDVSLATESVEVQSVKKSAVLAEFVAMTLFVILGCGSAMGSCKEPGWVLQVALTFGLAITALAYAVGHYSGAQINCAVTFGLVLAGKVTVAQGLCNFVAQMLGSIAGAFILTAMIPEEKDKTGGLGSNGVSEGMSKVNALVGEVFMTFLLVFVVLETAISAESKANRVMAALAIGFAVFLAHSVMIPIDGCSINPTRSFGPALVRKFCYKNAGSFEEMWVFWAGPLLGAAGAVFVSTKLLAA